MARMLVIYRQPADPQAFLRHYHEVHVPLARQLPGLRRYEVSTGPIVAPAGWNDAFLVATLQFDSLAAIQAAFATDCGHACAADRRVLAPGEGDVQMYLFDDREI